ncbi:MAG: hypothetical protein JNL73_14835 [Anaerolineales bacterium]|nr:hypothetical protein [Anaerolineales bacterium]
MTRRGRWIKRHPQGAMRHVVIGLVCVGLGAVACAPLAVPPYESPDATATLEAAYPVPELHRTPYTAQTQVAATLGAVKAADATQFFVDSTRSPEATWPVTPFLTGTAEGPYVQASGKMLGLAVTNAWFGYVDGNPVSVWASVDPVDPERGSLEVLWSWPGRSSDGRYLTQSRHGPVRIIAERQNRLTLSAEDGTLFYFDVPGLQFVDSLEVVVATASPPPTRTPFTPGQPETEPPAYPYP